MEGQTVRRRPEISQRLRASPVSYALAATNVLVFLWVEAHGSSTDPATLVRFGALVPVEVWQGQWWRLLTAAFLHIGLLHLALNVGFGLGWCVLVEGALGSPRFLALYLVSALGGSALSMFGHHDLSAGASGAIFGVVGATLALHRRVVGSWGAFLRTRGARFTLANLAVLAVVGFWLPFDQLAHAGGLTTGAVMAWLWSRPAPRRAWVWAVFAAGFLLVLAAALRPDPRWVADRALREIDAALNARDPARARTLVDAARARGVDAPGLDLYDGFALAQQGELEGALAKLRPLAERKGRVGEEARHLAAQVSRNLAIQLLSGEAPRDPERGRALLEEACRDGDPEACRVGKALDGSAAP